MSANADSYYFKVERAVDDGLFTPIGTFDAQNGPDYSFIDPMSESGNNNYRICIIYPDGQVSYSKILTIQNSIREQISVFPNPAIGGRFFIQVPSIETATISVYTMDGHLLLIKSLAGQLKYSISLPKVQNQQLLVVQLVSKNRSDSFSLLNLP